MRSEEADRPPIGTYPARRSWSAESKAFIDPERKPSRSSVTNLNPRRLKMAVNSAAIAWIQSAIHFLPGDLDADDVPVMPYTELAEAESANRFFAAFDDVKRFASDRAAVFDPRGKTGRRRLVPDAKAGMREQVREFLAW